MKYVSKCSGHGYLRMKPGVASWVEVTDTETGSVAIYDIPTRVPSGVYGHATFIDADSHFFVPQGDRELMLYEYIEKVEEGYCQKIVQGRHDDLIRLEGGNDEFSRSFHEGSNRLIIDSGSESIDVRGVKGSICMRWLKFGTMGVHIVTLYDLLCELCRETRVNILKYDSITICSEMRRDLSEIHLIHTPESEIFFSKMRLL